MRGHLSKFGLVVAGGPTALKTVAGIIYDAATELSEAVRDIVRLYLDQIVVLTQKLDELHFDLSAATKANDAMRRLWPVLGVGPVTQASDENNYRSSRQVRMPSRLRRDYQDA